MQWKADQVMFTRDRHRSLYWSRWIPSIAPLQIPYTVSQTKIRPFAECKDKNIKKHKDVILSYISFTIPAQVTEFSRDNDFLAAIS